jgi:hypothetical protein
MISLVNNENDDEGSSSGLIRGTNTEFVRRDRGKLRRTSVKVAGFLPGICVGDLSKKKQEC